MADLENVPTRSKEEVLQEYNSLAAQAGDKQFRLQVMGAELNHMHQKMFDLNSEMQAILKAIEAASQVAGTIVGAVGAVQDAIHPHGK